MAATAEAEIAGAGGSDTRPVVILTTERDTAELEALVAAVGSPLVGVVRQLRSRPDPSTFLGRGKLADVRDLLATHTPPSVSAGAPVVVANAELKPLALFNLEDELHVEVWDRVRLILEIFQRNARVKEARLQVELARLRYELPFVHEALHRQLTGEHPGFMGGGEVEARTYETHLKRRTKAILRELERVKRERRTRRAGRRRAGLRLLAIAGYTNSGKSSLLNELTGSTVVSQQRVFTTLQTATRRLQSGYHEGKASDLLFTDTVGFIRNLPPWLIDAFASTLEEITYADAVLLVADASEPPALVEEKLRTALRILEQVHAPRRRVVLLHKADLVVVGDRDSLRRRLKGPILQADVPVLFSSTRTGEGIQELVDLLLGEVLESRQATLTLDLARPEHLQFEHWLRDHAEVLESDDDGARRRLVVRCPLPSWGLLLHEASQVGLAPQETGSRRNQGVPPP